MDDLYYFWALQSHWNKCAKTAITPQEKALYLEVAKQLCSRINMTQAKFAERQNQLDAITQCLLEFQTNGHISQFALGSERLDVWLPVPQSPHVLFSTYPDSACQSQPLETAVRTAILDWLATSNHHASPLSHPVNKLLRRIHDLLELIADEGNEDEPNMRF